MPLLATIPAKSVYDLFKFQDFFLLLKLFLIRLKSFDELQFLSFRRCVTVLDV